MTSLSSPRNRFVRPVLAVAAGLLLALPASSRAGNEEATVGLFLADSASRPCNITLPSCESPSIVVTGDLYTPYYAYLCVFNGDAQEGIRGVQLSLSYDGGSGSGVDISSWTRCATLEFPSTTWPASRSGNTITWEPDACQQEEPGGFGTGVTALAGWFYVTAYSDDKLAVIPRVVDGQLKVASCAGAEAVLKADAGGWLGFSSDGSVKGKLICSGRTFEDATWGRIKDEYGSDRR